MTKKKINAGIMLIFLILSVIVISHTLPGNWSTKAFIRDYTFRVECQDRFGYYGLF